MEKHELKEKIMAVLGGMNLASFATIKDGKPWVRYVMASTKGDLDIYFTAFKNSRKVSQISKDPHCHILLGGDAKDFTKPYLQVEGMAEIIEALETKKEFWMDYHGTMFKGPEDPNFVVIKVKPEVIEYWGTPGKMEPEVYDMRKVSA